MSCRANNDTSLCNYIPKVEKHQPKKSKKAVYLFKDEFNLFDDTNTFICGLTCHWMN